MISFVAGIIGFALINFLIFMFYFFDNGAFLADCEWMEILEMNLIFIALYIGSLMFLISGLKSVSKIIIANIIGFKTYAYVFDVLPANSSLNGEDLYNVHILVANKHGQVQECVYPVWLNYQKYPVGSYVKVKYFGTYAKVLRKIDEYEIPYDIKLKINNTYSNLPKPEKEKQVTLNFDGYAYTTTRKRKSDYNFY